MGCVEGMEVHLEKLSSEFDCTVDPCLFEEREARRGSVDDYSVSAVEIRLFVVHAPEDTWFIDGFLLPALAMDPLEVLVSTTLGPGSIIVNELELGVLSAPTILLLSPAFFQSWRALFASTLAAQKDAEAQPCGRSMIIPAILSDCDMPLMTRSRVPVDFRNSNRTHWNREVERLRRALLVTAPNDDFVICPYPGLRSFGKEDAAYFYGRDLETRAVLGCLRDGRREIYVIGPSGSGKTSFIFAGLLPSILSAPSRAGGTYLVRQMRPGAKPAAKLSEMLEGTSVEECHVLSHWTERVIERLISNASKDSMLLMVIDQLEEVFTIANELDRKMFFSVVRELRRHPRIVMIFALRADFYASLMESELWRDLDGQLLRLDVAPLRGQQLRRAVETPARVCGVFFEPALLERLLNDVADAPGALPMLQDTLVELWHQRTHRLLRLAEYEGMSEGGRNGLAVTLSRRADGAMKELSLHKQKIARRILLRLVQFNDGNLITRRQQSRVSLSGVVSDVSDLDKVLSFLVDRRLVTVTSDLKDVHSINVDLAHEVLLTAWPTFKEWIRLFGEDERRRRLFAKKAADWVRRGRGTSRLLDVSEVAELRNWLDGGNAFELGVDDDIEKLMKSSEAAIEARREEQEKDRVKLRLLVWVCFGLVLVSGLFGFGVGACSRGRGETSVHTASPWQ